MVYHRSKFCSIVGTMIQISKALATNLKREIEARRAEVRHSPNAEVHKHWTDRDIERRTDEAGNKLVHTLVRRIRLGERERGLTVDEWLLLSLVLSVPPLDLLGDDPIAIGDTEHDPEAVRRWIMGMLPLKTVPERDRHKWLSHQPKNGGRGSHVATVLRDAAARYDGESPREKHETTVALLSTLVGSLRAASIYGDQMTGTNTKGGEQ